MDTYTLSEDVMVEQVVERILTDIHMLYDQHGLYPKAYHNTKHTLDVMADADAIALEMLLSPHDRNILRCAAAGHDAKHGLGSGHNERASAAKLFLAMHDSGFNKADCERASKLVLATALQVGEDEVKQAITDDPLSKILADADLANLGKEPMSYWASTTSLYREIHPGVVLDRLQIAEFGWDFINKHEFYTEAAERLFPHHEANMDFLESVLDS